ncbi:M14 family zinc carboxypeptidase [uncultured Winogradskyella sp.]|uniref:M14 family zinc carboxypeptidase n=1 Tax=uncultured Winogradskyella sp. TaxID=395353 RepID=UPI0030DBF412|tara:strand:- start:123540 stop:124685 length:1146 start_codon:yes stop_codon:yes gene_type:complete
MHLNDLNTAYTSVKESKLFGRYITNTHIEKCFNGLSKSSILTIGYSVNKLPIYSMTYGTGKIKILLWSQMHGNESTTTKALFDCFKLFETGCGFTDHLLSNCTICVIPILNPDGAERYTRLNANGVDINRDAQELSQPESKVLRALFMDFKPHYCFNLHGQRTIYSVDATNVSATLSFLAPSQDENCSLTPNRKDAMSVITTLHSFLQTDVPNGISRYDDTFNLNCVGDTFQSFGVPTLLYEAGHYPNDYSREVVRRFMFLAILKGLDCISKGAKAENYDAYFNIPENKKMFYDIIIRNAKLSTLTDEATDIAIQYKEVLYENEIKFVPVVEAITNLNAYYGHKEIDANFKIVKNSDNSVIKVANEIVFVVINNQKTSLKP